MKRAISGMEKLAKILSFILFFVFFVFNCFSGAADGWTNPAKINGTACYSKWPGMNNDGTAVAYLYDNTGAYDDKKIMVVEYANGQWLLPVKLAENGHYSTESVQWLPWETRPVISGNGNTIVYVGGLSETIDQGGGPVTVISPQLYLSEKNNGQWSTPTRLDVGIPRVHHILSVSDDGNTIAFSSFPANIFGESPVLYIITRSGGVWGSKTALTDQNAGAAVNPSLSADGKKVIWIQNNRVWFSENTGSGWTPAANVVDNPLFGSSIEYPKLGPNGDFITYWKFPIVQSVLQPGHLYLLQRTAAGTWTQPAQVTKDAVTTSHVTTGYAAQNEFFSRQIYGRPFVSGSGDDSVIVASNLELADLSITGWKFTSLTSITSGYNANPVLSRDGMTLIYQGPDQGCDVLLFSKASSSNNTPVRSLSGAVSYGTGPLKNASITLSNGSINLTVNTDASGNYGFTGITDGTYTVTPSKKGYVFNPASSQVTISGSSASSIDFSASNTPGTIVYFGSIRDSSLQVFNFTFVFNVQLLSDPSINASVEPDGSFVLAGVPAGVDFQLKIVPESSWWYPVISKVYNSTENIKALWPFVLLSSSEYQLSAYQPGITGRVITSTGQLAPIGSASVSCKNSANGQEYTVAYFKDNKLNYTLTATDTNGIFFCYGFSAEDEISVTASKENYTFDTIRFKGLAGPVGEDVIIGVYDAPPISSIVLQQGWNFISFPRLPSTSIDITAVLADVSSGVRIVWGFDNTNKVWLKYKPSTQNPTLSTLEAGKGYWIYMDVSGTIDLSTWIGTSKTVNLIQGWNLTGYAGTDGADINTALSAISGQWVIIWSWVNGQWYAKHPTLSNLPVLPFNTLNQGKAYWIKVNAATTWQQ